MGALCRGRARPSVALCKNLAACPSALTLYFHAHVLRLGGGGKKPLVVCLEKVKYVFFNCQPERIDHGDFKDSNFEDDGQPEIVTWPPRAEVYLYL